MNWFKRVFEKRTKVKIYLFRDKDGAIGMLKAKPLRGESSFFVPTQLYGEPEGFNSITWENSPIEAEIRFKQKRSNH